MISPKSRLEKELVQSETPKKATTMDVSLQKAVSGQPLFLK